MTTLTRKMECLAACLGRDAAEDAAAHLCDLLEYCRLRIRTDGGMMFADLAAVVAHYGRKPRPPRKERA